MCALFTLKGFYFHPKSGVKSHNSTYVLGDFCFLSIRLSATALVRMMNQYFTVFPFFFMKQMQY
jgi:hypothetical protein